MKSQQELIDLLKESTLEQRRIVLNEVFLQIQETDLTTLLHGKWDTILMQFGAIKREELSNFPAYFIGAMQDRQRTLLLIS